MKIWQSYGAEHSLNLVIIGRFKEVADAEEFKLQTESLIDFLSAKTDFDMDGNRFDRDVSEYLGNKNIHCLSPQQLGQFLYEMHMEQHGNEVRITSDDDLNGIISWMLHKGAKIEVFSAHDYPESDN